MLTPATRSLQATIKRILKPFQSDLLKEFVSGMNDTSAIGAIDDGEYGDPTKSSKPDFVQKDDIGWV